MKFCYKDELIDWRIVLATLFLCSIHLLAVKLVPLGYIVAFLEAMVLLLTAAYRRLDLYLYAFLIILGMSFEFPMFVDSSLIFVPSIVMLPFLKGYFFLLISLWPLPVLIKNKGVWKSISNRKNLLLLASFSFLTLVVGVIVGIISLLIDNTSIAFRIPFFLKDIIGVGIFSLYALYFVYACLYYERFVGKIELLLFSSLVAIIFVAFISVLLGVRGDYEGQDIILMPLSFFFSTSIIFLLFYKRYYKKHWKILFLLLCMAFYMQISCSNALNGKSWLVIVYICIVLLCMGLKKHAIKTSVGIFIMCCCFSLFSNLLEKQESQDSLSFSKLTQAISLISVVDINWYEKMPLSPKMRIEEFLNTSLEYVEHPFYLLFGKGFGGGHKDYRCSYGNYNPSAFSLEEYNNGYFISLHESLNVFFLKFGLIGVILLFSIVFRIWKSMEKSPWLIIGSLWLLLFWGYSFSLMSIGLPALVIGINKLDEFSWR